MHTLLKYIIVEDQKIEALHLRSTLLKYKSLQYSGTAENASDAIELIESCLPEVVFMDVKIPGTSGMDLVRQLKEKMQIVIFVSSYTEYAVEGFELFALDFLLKPVREDRLEITIQRIMDYWSMKELSRAQHLYAQKESIVIKEGNKEIIILASDIFFVEAMQDYMKIVTSTNKYTLSCTLSKFLEMQLQGVFVQIHRRYAVVRKNIRYLEPDKVICEQGTLPLGKSFYQELKKEDHE